MAHRYHNHPARNRITAMGQSFLDLESTSKNSHEYGIACCRGVPSIDPAVGRKKGCTKKWSSWPFQGAKVPHTGKFRRSVMKWALVTLYRRGLWGFQLEFWEYSFPGCRSQQVLNLLWGRLDCLRAGRCTKNRRVCQVGLGIDPLQSWAVHFP